MTVSKICYQYPSTPQSVVTEAKKMFTLLSTPFLNLLVSVSGAGVSRVNLVSYTITIA